VTVRPTAEIRTTWPVNEVAVDGGRAATLVGATPSWQYALVWSPKGVVVRAHLACTVQESNVVLAGDRLAHVCNGGGTNTVLTATLQRTRGRPQLRTHDYVSLAGRGSLIAGSSGRTLWRFDDAKKVKLRAYPTTIVALDADGGDILVGRTNTVLDLVSRTGTTLATLRIAHLGGALLRGDRIASIANHHVTLSDLHGKTIRTRPVVGNASLVDIEGNLVVYSGGTQLHLLRLSDGRDVRLRFKGQFGYASAKLSHGSLFYAYNQAGSGEPGHAGYLSAAAVQALLRR
jgi:hypothetical protein